MQFHNHATISKTNSVVKSENYFQKMYEPRHLVIKNWENKSKFFSKFFSVVAVFSVAPKITANLPRQLVYYHIWSRGACLYLLKGIVCHTEHECNPAKHKVHLKTTLWNLIYDKYLKIVGASTIGFKLSVHLVTVFLWVELRWFQNLWDKIAETRISLK